MKRLVSIALAALLCLAASTTCFSQETGNATSEASGGANASADSVPAGQTPVRIKADKMSYSDTGKTVSFFGNVTVIRDNMTLWTDKITAYFSEQGRGDKIDSIVAEGNVRVAMDGRKGHCRKLTYYVEDGILRMEGSPVLTEGKNTVRGAVIKFYLKDNRSEILGGRNRQVEAVFVTPKDFAP